VLSFEPGCAVIWLNHQLGSTKDKSSLNAHTHAHVCNHPIAPWSGALNSHGINSI